MTECKKFDFRAQNEHVQMTSLLGWQAPHETYIKVGMHYPSASADGMTIGGRLRVHEQYMDLIPGKIVLFVRPVLTTIHASGENVEGMRKFILGKESSARAAVFALAERCGWAKLVQAAAKDGGLTKGGRFARLEGGARVAEWRALKHPVART